MGILGFPGRNQDAHLSIMPCAAGPSRAVRKTFRSEIFEVPCFFQMPPMPIGMRAAASPPDPCHFGVQEEFLLGNLLLSPIPQIPPRRAIQTLIANREKSFQPLVSLLASKQTEPGYGGHGTSAV